MSTHFLPSDGTTSQVSPLTLTLEDATNFVTKRAKELVDKLVKQRKHEEPPFLAEEFARLQGTKIEKTDLGEIDALLIRDQNGYIIRVNENHHPVRQNFSCAHEIGHTFLHELGRPLSLDNDEFRWTKSNSAGRAKERLCHIAAAELLMPEKILQVLIYLLVPSNVWRISLRCQFKLLLFVFLKSVQNRALSFCGSSIRNLGQKVFSAILCGSVCILVMGSLLPCLEPSKVIGL